MTPTLVRQPIAFSLEQMEVQAMVTGKISGMQIKDILQQALTTGHLSIAAENQLRRLLRCKLDGDDLNAFWTLQNAIITGCIKQESRELRNL